LVSVYLEKKKEQGKLWKIIKGKELHFKGFSIHSTTLVSGILFLVLGYLIFSGSLYSFNQYITSSGFQKVIFIFEEWLIGLVG